MPDSSQFVLHVLQGTLQFDHLVRAAIGRRSHHARHSGTVDRVLCSTAGTSATPAHLGVLSGEARGEAVGLYERRRVFLAVQGDLVGVHCGELRVFAVLDDVMAKLRSFLTSGRSSPTSSLVSGWTLSTM